MVAVGWEHQRKRRAQSLFRLEFDVTADGAEVAAPGLILLAFFHSRAAVWPLEKTAVAASSYGGNSGLVLMRPRGSSTTLVKKEKLRGFDNTGLSLSRAP
jgi:hypothetical protein